jgi:hypothetical protein
MLNHLKLLRTYKRKETQCLMIWRGMRNIAILIWAQINLKAKTKLMGII